MTMMITEEANLRRVVAEEVQRALQSVLEAVGRDPGSQTANGRGTLMTVAQLAALLHVDLRCLRRMVRAGEVPAPITIGERTLRWRRKSIETWLRRKEPKA